MTLTPWWVRPGLEIGDGRLRIAGEDAEAGCNGVVELGEDDEAEAPGGVKDAECGA